MDGSTNRDQMTLLIKKFITFAELLFHEGKISMDQYKVMVNKKVKFLENDQNTAI